MKRRLHLVELHDQPWFPAAWRDHLTDFMSLFATTFRPYAAIAPLLAAAIDRAGAEVVVDLCSGAGAPLLSVEPLLARALGRPLRIVLTDLYPNRAAFRRLDPGAAGRVRGLERPVDATDVPAELGGFRTLFTSFHHFPPDAARRILADAARKGQGIGVFEYTERNLLVWGLPLLLTPLLVMLGTPLLRPFRPGRLLWTYALPVVPLVAATDGLVSCLRTYSPGELLELARSVPVRGYTWESGRVRSFGASRVTWLIGLPGPAAG